MNLVKVNDVGVKALQAGVERLTNIFGTGPFLTFAHFHSKLRGDDCFMAPTLKSPAKKLLALSSTINVRCIEKVDAGFECGIDDRRCSCGVRSPTEVVTTDANKGHFKRSKPSIFHEDCLPKNFLGE